MDLGSFYTGKVISSGLFQLWLSEGIVCYTHLKLVSLINLLFSTLCILGGYIYFHISFFIYLLIKKLSIISIHHIFISIGSGLLS